MFLEKPNQSIFPTSATIDKVDPPQKLMTAMASEFPVQQFTASPSQYTLYNSQSQQISPINSATATPNNTSPTSPQTTLPPRQLRAPKVPLYVPAVLRPTEPPRRVTRQSPLTPPHSSNNSFDDLENARKLNRHSTGDSGKFGLGAITEAEWSTEGLGKVTDLPTREHWKVCQRNSLVWIFEFILPCTNKIGARGLQTYIWSSGIMSQYLDGHRVLREKIGCNGETPHAQILLKASLGCKARSPEQNSFLSHQPIRLVLHTPRDHWLRSFLKQHLLRICSNSC